MQRAWRGNHYRPKGALRLMVALSSPLPRPGTWGALWRLTKRHRARMALLAASSFLGATLEAGFLVALTTTLLSLVAGETTIGPVLGRSVGVTTMLWGAAGLLVLRLVFQLASVRISAGLTTSIRTEQRRRLARAFLHASWEVQHGEAAGRLQELLSGFVWRVTNAVTALNGGVSALLSLMAFLGTGITVNAPVTLAVLLVLAVLGAVLTPVRRRIRYRARESAENDLEFAGTVAELSMLGQEMQTFGVTHKFIHRIDSLTLRTSESLRRVQVLQGVLTPTYTTIAYGAVLLGLAVLAGNPGSDLSTIGAVGLLMLRSLSYGQQLIAMSGTVASSVPSLESLEEALAKYESAPAHAGAARPPRATPMVLKDASFEYRRGATALHPVTATVEHGEVVGVIGPSGAGKSTLAQLMLGLRPPTTGSIRVGGVDLNSVDRSWWTDQVAFVPQSALLLTGTVAENLRFFREGIDDAALRLAASQANVLDDIEKMPRGFDTHLGERGGHLSGGQRQRLSIARALAGRPELLVLDEPTSALDGHSESLIRDALAALHGQMTVVIIAHRMSTLDMCDRIMVIEGGRVTALDTPDNLRRDSAFYRRALAVAGLS